VYIWVFVGTAATKIGMPGPNAYSARLFLQLIQDVFRPCSGVSARGATEGQKQHKRRRFFWTYGYLLTIIIVANKIYGKTMRENMTGVYCEFVFGLPGGSCRFDSDFSAGFPDFFQGKKASL